MQDSLSIPGRPDERQPEEVFDDRLPDDTFSPLPADGDLKPSGDTLVDSPHLSPSPEKKPSPVKAPEPSQEELAEAQAKKQQKLPEAMPPPPTVSFGALDRRIRRVMTPNAKGQHKVSEDIRQMWADGQKDKVFKLFAECDNDVDLFTKKYSVKKDQEKEFELGVFFTFKTEADMAEMPEILSCIPLNCVSEILLVRTHMYRSQYHGGDSQFNPLAHSLLLFPSSQPRKERDNILARGKANPKKFMRLAYLFLLNKTHSGSWEDVCKTEKHRGPPHVPFLLAMFKLDRKNGLVRFNHAKKDP